MMDDVVLLAGAGPQVLAEAAQLTGVDSAVLLRRIVGELLVRKGVDWTAPILAEYLGLHAGSLGTFVLAWDRVARRFVAHGAMFQSVDFPQVGLVAHIRTDEGCKGRGLGTRVTARVLQAGFENGAAVVVLATDDKLHRVQAGEKAAKRMYEKLGFVVLAEKQLADTVDWLMVVNPGIAAEMERSRDAQGRLPAGAPEGVARLQAELVARLRSNLSAPQQPQIQPVGNGDLAGLFLLLNLCPPDDFRLKLSAWNVQVGPELEREFVVNLRPALEDRDRAEDVSHVLRDANGLIAAVCAAKQEAPFTRRTFRVDFYCLPELLRTQPELVRRLVAATITALPRPTRLAFWGADAEKTTVFQKLGFVRTGNRASLSSPQTGLEFTAEEFARELAR
jgi:GNAT superfamily N-acetyltransferase